MKKYYLSKNYRDLGNAGNKAKTDIEQIMSSAGYLNAGFPQTQYKNSLWGFLVTLFGVLKLPFSVSRGDLLVLQYPLKKYYSFACRMAHWRGCRVVTLIHDLGAFRRKKLTVEQEIKRLSNSDYLIVHNTFMKEWLLKQGYKKPMGCLEIFDYLSATEASVQNTLHQPFQVVYAGGLSYKKNRFLYGVDDLNRTWHFNLYGGGFEWERIQNKTLYAYKGFVPSDQLIATVEGDFGLVWDGEAIHTCSGSFGEYLQYNNPHKTSLYIRCQLPVIVWSKAAMASFIRKNEIGICIDSLDELDKRLADLTPEEYRIMKQNTVQISQRLASGFYCRKALDEAESYLQKKI